MSAQPFVSIIIPVWNSPGLIAKCLQALERQTYPRDRFEVLVIDNGSSDNTPDVVSSFAFATALSEPAPGSYSARNRGLQAARGDYVAFTDADCVPDPLWLQSAVEAALEHPDAGVLGGRIELFSVEGDGGTICEKYETLFSFNQALYIRSGHCATANWMSPRKLLQEMGGFNDKQKSGGDFELSRRIHATGLPLVYVPGMLVLHPFRGQLRDLVAKRRRTAGGQWNTPRTFARQAKYLLGIPYAGLKQILAALSASRLNLRDRLNMSLLIVVLSSAELFEIIRLSFGGEARRA